MEYAATTCYLKLVAFWQGFASFFLIVYVEEEKIRVVPS
jgi:hypothetical protein